MHCIPLILIFILILIFAEEIVHAAKGVFTWVGGYFLVLGVLLAAFAGLSVLAVAFFRGLATLIGHSAASRLGDLVLYAIIFVLVPAVYLDSVDGFPTTRRVFRFVTSGVPERNA